MTFNIRCDNHGDRQKQGGINSWENRRASVRDLLLQESPDCLGLQEAYYHQYQYLNQTLESEYFSSFIGRDDGKKEGEGSVIFVKKSLFSIKDEDVFWLSSQPYTVGSIATGAQLPRICSYLLLETQDGFSFLFFNTHFSHVSSLARCHAAQLILDKKKELFDALPFFLVGDLNALQESEEIKILASKCREGREIASQNQKKRTFNDFQEGDLWSEDRIDYIFYSNDFKAEIYTVCDEKKANRFISDHAGVTLSCSYDQP